MLRTGGILFKFLYNYITDKNESDNYNDIQKKNDKLRVLSDTLASYGGVLTKISQLLNYDNENNQNYSDCKPYNQEGTTDYLKKIYNEDKELFRNVKSLDFNVLKAGSVGQIHRGIYNDDKDIIIKIQYSGLYDQFIEDIDLVDLLTKYLYRFIDLEDSIKEIKKKLFEELDYKLEYNNHLQLYNLWKDHENIKIPELINELCTNNLLGMEYIDGQVLNEFIDTSTQDERNHIGRLLVIFIFHNFFKHGIYYSDIHYGNFIVKSKNILYVTDFGCIHYLEKDLLENLINLYNVMLTDNKQEFYNVVEKMGIIKGDISNDSKEYMYYYFKIQFEPWITDEFEFSKSWLDKALHKNLDYMKEWKLPSNLVYLNKIAYGFYYLCTKLKLKGQFVSIITNIIM